MVPSWIQPLHRRIQEQRARQPVLQAAGRVGRLVLQVQPDPWTGPQVHRKQMRVGGPPEVGLDLLVARASLAGALSGARAFGCGQRARHRERERRPHARRAFDRDVAAQDTGELAAERKAQARAAVVPRSAGLGL